MTTNPQSNPSDREEVIFKRSRLPGILKVLCVVLSLGFLMCGVFFMAEEGDGSMGAWAVRLMVSGILLAIICMLMQAVLFSGYIAFDPSSRELIVVSRGLIPPLWRQRFTTKDVVAVHFRETHGVMSPGHGELWLVPASGSNRLLTLLSNDEPGPELAAAVAKAIGLKYEDDPELSNGTEPESDSDS